MAETRAEFQARLAADFEAHNQGLASADVVYRVGGTGTGTTISAIVEDRGIRTEEDDLGTKTFHEIDVDLSLSDVAAPAVMDTIEYNSLEFTVHDVERDDVFGCARVMASRDTTVELAHASYRNQRR